MCSGLSAVACILDMLYSNSMAIWGRSIWMFIATNHIICNVGSGNEVLHFSYAVDHMKAFTLIKKCQSKRALYMIEYFSNYYVRFNNNNSKHIFDIYIEHVLSLGRDKLFALLYARRIAVKCFWNNRRGTKHFIILSHHKHITKCFPYRVRRTHELYTLHPAAKLDSFRDEHLGSIDTSRGTPDAHPLIRFA